MNLILIALAAASPASGSAANGQPDIQMRTIGAHTPGRVDARRCMWTATVSGTTHSGSTPGACHSDTSHIEGEIARREEANKASL